MARGYEFRNEDLIHSTAVLGSTAICHVVQNCMQPEKSRMSGLAVFLCGEETGGVGLWGGGHDMLLVQVLLGPTWATLVETSKGVTICRTSATHHWCTVKGNLNFKVITLLIINRFLPFKFHIKIFFLSKWLCKWQSRSKRVTDLPDDITALDFMTGYNWLSHTPEDKHKILWSDAKKQDKPMSTHFQLHCCWPTNVVHSVCRVVVSNS